MTDKLEQMRKNGIDLKLRREIDDILYLGILMNWFMKSTDCMVVRTDNHTFTILQAPNVNQITIQKSILKYSQQMPFEVIMHILDFVSTLHKSTLQLIEDLHPTTGTLQILYPSITEIDFR